MAVRANCEGDKSVIKEQGGEQGRNENPKIARACFQTNWPVETGFRRYRTLRSNFYTTEVDRCDGQEATGEIGERDGIKTL